MEIKDIINNVNIYGFDNSIIGSKYPMSVDINSLNNEITPTINALGTSKIGEGHDNFLNGIIVQFDLTFTNKAWVELERYHFIDFISSQSTMHRITRFNLDNSYNEYVDPKVIEIMKNKVKLYNDKLSINKDDPSLKELYLQILYTNPCGFKLTAKMTTNYRQLKTIYKQRKNHKLKEWQVFCEWLETLPHSNFITTSKEKYNG